MRDNHDNKAVVQWLVPSSIMLLVIIFLLIRFSVTSRQAESQEVEDRLISSAQFYVSSVVQMLDSIQKSGDTAAKYMGQLYEEEVDIPAMLEAVHTSANTYETVICDITGNGYRLSGESVEIGQTSYFDQILSGSNMVYTAKEGIDEKSAIVIVSPIKWYENVTGYVLNYYDTANFENIFKRSDFGTGAFYILMEKDGSVVATAGNRESIFLNESEDYYSFLKQNSDNKKKVEKMYTQIQNGVNGICYASLDQENRGIVFASVDGQQFCLLVGVTKNYIDRATKGEWASVRSMVWQLIVILLAFVGVVVVINIISRIRENEKSRQLADKADTDLLTTLYNKVATERKIKEYIAAHPDQMGLMFILDIDNFKKINDTMGHAFGDEVLHTLGIQISAEFRTTDILGRTGGDEFTVFLCNMKEDAIIKAEAQRMERFFKNFQAGEYVKYSATASIGAAVFPRDAKDFEGLYKAADHALYVAKKRGKNQLAFYGDDK